MHRMEPWLERDTLCGTWRAKTHLACTFPLRSRHSSSTYSLKSIGPRKERNESSCVVVKLGSCIFKNKCDNAGRRLPLQWWQQPGASNCTCPVPLQVGTDSTAARVRDDETWIQPCDASGNQSTLVPRRNRTGSPSTVKVDSESNPVDVSTKIPKEWTQRDERWITEESGADDTMKGV